MQSPGKHSTGNTQTSVALTVQLASLEQKLPPTEHVPDAQSADVVQKAPSSAQRLLQSMSRKQFWLVPMH